jgi:hypothetical protein
MSARRTTPSAARPGKSNVGGEEPNMVLPPPPPYPPESEAELAKSREITRLLRELADDLKQRNLNWAIALAQQAARGRGPLVDHFAELGRRFGPSIQAHEKPSKFQVIEGGNLAPKVSGR